jgi:hypothetical protein
MPKGMKAGRVLVSAFDLLVSDGGDIAPPSLTRTEGELTRTTP